MIDDEKESIKNILVGMYSGRPDYSVAFVRKAVASLKPGSVLATIIPATFLESEAAGGLRASIEQDETLSVRVIGRLSYDVFKNAEIEPAFLVIRREIAPLDSEYDPVVRMILTNKGGDDAAIRAMRKYPDGEALGLGWEIFKAPLSLI